MTGVSIKAQQTRDVAAVIPDTLSITLEAAQACPRYCGRLVRGVDATAALQHVVHIILASPQFLYRVEYDPESPGTLLTAHVVERALATIERHSMFAQGDSVIVAFSGGPDSTCLKPSASASTFISANSSGW